MSQISPPIRIVLAGAALFLVVWMVALRPGGEEAETPAPAPNVQTGAPAQSAPGQAVQQAQGAAAATEANSAASAGTTTSTTEAPTANGVTPTNGTTAGQAKAPEA